MPSCNLNENVSSIKLYIRTDSVLQEPSFPKAWLAWGLDRSLQTHPLDAYAERQTGVENDKSVVYGSEIERIIELKITNEKATVVDVLEGSVRMLAIASSPDDLGVRPAHTPPRFSEETKLGDVELKHRFVSTLVEDMSFSFRDLHAFLPVKSPEQEKNRWEGAQPWKPTHKSIFQKMNVFVDVCKSCITCKNGSKFSLQQYLHTWHKDDRCARHLALVKECTAWYVSFVTKVNKAAFNIQYNNRSIPQRMPYNKSYFVNTCGQIDTCVSYAWLMTEPHYVQPSTLSEVPLHPATLLAAAWHSTTQPWPNGAFESPADDDTMGERLDALMTRRYKLDQAGDVRAWGLHPMVAEQIALQTEELDPDRPAFWSKVGGSTQKDGTPLTWQTHDPLEHYSHFELETMQAWLAETVCFVARGMPYKADIIDQTGNENNQGLSVAHEQHVSREENAHAVPVHDLQLGATHKAHSLGNSEAFVANARAPSTRRGAHVNAELFAPVGVAEIAGDKTWGDDCESLNGHAFKMAFGFRTLYLTLLYWAKSCEQQIRDRAEHWAQKAPRAVALGRLALEFEPVMVQCAMNEPGIFDPTSADMTTKDLTTFLKWERYDDDYKMGKHGFEALRMKDPHKNATMAHMTAMLIPHVDLFAAANGGRQAVTDDLQRRGKQEPCGSLPPVDLRAKEVRSPSALLPTRRSCVLTTALLECTQWSASYQPVCDTPIDDTNGAMPGPDRKNIAKIIQEPWVRHVNMRACRDLGYRVYNFVSYLESPGLALPVCLGGMGTSTFQVRMGGHRNPGAENPFEFSASSTGAQMSDVMTQGFAGTALGKETKSPIHIVPSGPRFQTLPEWSNFLRSMHIALPGRMPTFWPMVGTATNTVEKLKTLETWCADKNNAHEKHLENHPSDKGPASGSRLIQFMVRDVEWTLAFQDVVKASAKRHNMTIIQTEGPRFEHNEEANGRAFVVTLKKSDCGQ
jgi:hypothetical protein